MASESIDIDINKFLFRGKGKFRIKDAANQVERVYDNKSDYRAKLSAAVKEIENDQAMMRAQNRYGLLLVFQAMDAAGKDSTIRKVMTGVNPAGVQVFNFKRPSDLELDHGYLWRVMIRMPERGRIGVFNRSYYEEVLVVRVHPDILREHQRLPVELTGDVDEVFENRYQEIKDFERYATRNGVRIVKFFLNVSKDEQRQRFLDRLQEPDKNWKFVASDMRERKFWDDYMRAYEDCINETATKYAPWYVIPADDKRNMRLIVAKIICTEMSKLHLAWPAADKEIVDHIDDYIAELNRQDG